MAKVLACPACGNKHPLDLLIGLDSFLCTNCGKKLAVPNEAMSVIKETVPPIPKVIDSKPAVALEAPERDEVFECEDVVVLAHSTITTTAPRNSKKAAPIEKTSGQAPKPENVNESNAQVKEEVQSNELPAKSTGLPGAIKDLSSIPIPLIGRVASWLFAIPFGFFMVVLLPRFFKKGFHASDFVGVITEPGIGRYAIVVTLIFLWSLATVVGVYLFNFLLRKFFLSKKVAR